MKAQDEGLQAKRESLRHICDGDCPETVKINYSHPVIGRLTVREQRELSDKIDVALNVYTFKHVKWSDHVPDAERAAWLSPGASLLNLMVWHIVTGDFAHALGAGVGEVLSSLGMPEDSLACLDEGDFDSLEYSLADAAASAYQSGDDPICKVHLRLQEWLQNLTESAEDDLGVLVHIVQWMATPMRPDEKADWASDGF